MPQIRQRFEPVGELRVTLPSTVPTYRWSEYNKLIRDLFGTETHIHWISGHQLIIEPLGNTIFEGR